MMIETYKTEDTKFLNLAEETKHISQTINIPYDIVLTIIKGIDAYYYLMGIQDELTFEDEYEMFIDGSIQRQKYDPDYVIEDDEMLAFISSHTDISDEIIETIMTEDMEYQQTDFIDIEAIKTLINTFSEGYVFQRPSGKWNDNEKKCIAEDTL